MLVIYVLGAVTLVALALATSRSSVPKRAVTAANILLVVLFSMWVIGFWLAQENSAQFCDFSGFMWLLVLNVPLIVGALVINWPFPKRQRHQDAQRST